MEDHGAEQAPVATGHAGVESTGEKRAVIDQVCDPCGIVPGNLDEAFAHKKKMKAMKAKEEEEEASKVAEPLEDQNISAADEAVDSVLSNFTCCAKPSLPDAEEKDEMKQFPDPEEQVVHTTHESESLADIAAKMDNIDLESAAENIAEDEMSGASDTDGNSMLKVDNGEQWYKQPLYAGLIVLSGSFAIAIVIVAILLIAN